MAGVDDHPERRRYYPDEEAVPLGTAIHGAVEAHENASLVADEFTLLQHVNPEAINVPFVDAPESDVEVSVQFDLDDVTVSVWSDGGIDIPASEEVQEDTPPCSSSLRGGIPDATRDRSQVHRGSRPAPVLGNQAESIRKRQMLVVEIRMSSPILSEALSHAPDMAIDHEEQYATDDGINFLFWAAGGDFSAFEEGLDADGTVTNVGQLAKTPSGRLYRVTFTERGEDSATFPSWGELDLILLDSTGTHDGWELRMQVPDRDALQRYRDVCEERGLGFDLKSIYEEVDATSPTEARLTTAQREALATARELGYYDIPRRTSMKEIAARLDISSQAVSERIRRGTRTLIDTTVDPRSE